MNKPTGPRLIGRDEIEQRYPVVQAMLVIDGRPRLTPCRIVARTLQEKPTVDVMLPDGEIHRNVAIDQVRFGQEAA